VEGKKYMSRVGCTIAKDLFPFDNFVNKCGRSAHLAFQTIISVIFDEFQWKIELKHYKNHSPPNWSPPKHPFKVNLTMRLSSKFSLTPFCTKHIGC
jgi:hypothetical protein